MLSLYPFSALSIAVYSAVHGLILQNHLDRADVEFRLAALFSRNQSLADSTIAYQVDLPIPNRLQQSATGICSSHCVYCSSMNVLLSMLLSPPVGAGGGTRPVLRHRPGRGSGVPPALHSLPLPFESPILFQRQHPLTGGAASGAGGGTRIYHSDRDSPCAARLCALSRKKVSAFLFLSPLYFPLYAALFTNHFLASQMVIW